MPTFLRSLRLRSAGTRSAPAAVWLLIIAGLWLSMPAPLVFAAGTAAGDSVTNGYFAATDTIPQSPGHLSIAYTPVNLPSDTVYGGSTASFSQSVDTGYDLAFLNKPSDSNAARARDTVSYAYGITNKGNATLTIDLAAAFTSVGSDTNWGSGAYKVFNDVDNDGIWEAGDTAITTVTLAAEASDTIVVVVLVPSTAVDDDSSGTRFYASDRAPIVSPSTTGDLWESGALIAGNDARDTQYDTVVTRVVGPNVRMTKTQALETGRSRPGDTIIYAITFDNEGGDSAVNVAVYDAVPLNAVYVPNSADSAELVGIGQGFVAAYDDTYSATNFNDTGNTTAKVIRWTLSAPLGVTGGDDRTAAEFTGNNDAGRVYYRVRIR